MAFEMVDRDERLAAGECDRLRRGEANDEPADEAGTCGRGDRIRSS
jgi:hypothetical protein